MLLSLALAVTYTGSLYKWPFGRTADAAAPGRTVAATPAGGRTCKSRRCDCGTVQRLGSRTGHRAVRSVIAYRQDR